MDMTDPGLRFPKAEPRCVSKKRRDKLDAKAEREARQIVNKRDGKTCRIPGCTEYAPHLHHVTYRSHSKLRRWDPDNLVRVCHEHHQLIHASVIHLQEDEDGEIVVTGDVNRLRFRL